MKGRFVLLVVLFLCITGVYAQEEWTLSFIERDTVSGDDTYADDAYFDIYLNDTRIARWNIAQEGHYGKQTIDLTPYNPQGKVLKFRLVRVQTSGIGVLLKDIEITRNGNPVRFSPWTFTSDYPRPAHRGYQYSDDWLAIVVAGSKIGEDGDLTFTSSVLTPAPELEIKQSDLNFNKIIWNISQGENIQISATVHNKGGVQANNALVSLYINDVNIQNSTVFNLGSGGSITKTFDYQVDFGDSKFLKIRALAVPEDESFEGQSDNNHAIKYIIKQRPIFFIDDWSNSPGVVYSNKEPYISLITQLESSILAPTNCLALDYTKTTYTEDSKSSCAEKMGLYYQITGDETYAIKTRDALLNIGGYSGFRWPDRNAAGSVVPNSNGQTLENYDLIDESLVGISLKYAHAYDFIHEYLKENNEVGSLNIIRDNFGRMAAKYYLMNKEINSYGDEKTSGKGRSGLKYHDESNEPIELDTALGGAALAVLDYDGQYQDLDGSPDDWIDLVVKDLTEESRKGASRTALQISYDEDGVYMDGQGYLDYHEPALSLFLSDYIDVFGESILSNSDIYGSLQYNLRSLMPNGIGALHGSSYAYMWWPMQISGHVFDSGSQERAIFNYYMDQDYLDDGKGPRYRPGGGDFSQEIFRLLYNSSESKEYSGESSYLGRNKSYVILRNTIKDRYNDMFSWFRMKDKPQIGITSNENNMQVFDLYAKGAYLIPSQGDPRGISGDPYGIRDYSKNYGRATVLVSHSGEYSPIYYREKSTQYGESSSNFQYDANPSTVVANLFSGKIDFVSSNINVKTVISGSTQGTLANPFNWTRNMIMPNEYLVVMDKMVSSSSNDYSINIPFGSTHFLFGTSANNLNHVNGSLYLDNTKVTWWNTATNQPIFNAYSDSSLQDIIWQTWSETDGAVGNSGRVTLFTRVNPSADATVSQTAFQYGEFGTSAYSTNVGYSSYAPLVMLERNGNNVKQIMVLYPTNSTDEQPMITNVQITGNDGDDYATKLTRSSSVDLMHISDGQTIEYDVVTTNSNLAFSRADSSNNWDYFLINDGSLFIYGGSDLMNSDRNLKAFLMNRSGVNRYIKADGDQPANVTVNIETNVNYVVKRNGEFYNNWGWVDSSHIWIYMTFNSPTEYEILSTDPLTMNLLTPENGNSYSNLTRTIKGNSNLPASIVININNEGNYSACSGCSFFNFENSSTKLGSNHLQVFALYGSQVVLREVDFEVTAMTDLELLGYFGRYENDMISDAELLQAFEVISSQGVVIPGTL